MIDQRGRVPPADPVEATCADRLLLLLAGDDDSTTTTPVKHGSSRSAEVRAPIKGKAGGREKPRLSAPRPDLDIPDKDLEITTMRSGGAGGQNVNKVNSAVRIKHLPSGLAVKCTQERSQAMNKDLAMKRLKAQACPTCHYVTRYNVRSQHNSI